MKYLLILLAVLGGIWLLRSGRAGRKAEGGAMPPVAGAPKVDGQVPGQGTSHATRHATPQAMVRCASCALHLPETDAVRGKLGWYCGTPHRVAHES